METIGPKDEKIPNTNTSFDKASKNVSKKQNKHSSSKESGNCILHGKNCGHTSHECCTLKYQTSIMKERYNSKNTTGQS